MLQCVAVCCSVLQCVAMCCSVSLSRCESSSIGCSDEIPLKDICIAVLQFVAVCCSVLKCVAVCCNPRVEWRGLKIGGGNLVYRKDVFCIFRCQSIYWESAAIM